MILIRTKFWQLIRLIDKQAFPQGRAFIFERKDVMKDHLVKATADGVRIYAAVTTDLVNEAIRRHDCYPVAAAALGRTMTGALLLAANLKNKEA